MWNRWILLLDERLGLLRQLAELSDRQREFLVTAQADEAAALNDALAALSEQALASDARLRRLLSTIKTAAGNQERLTVGELLERAPNQARQAIAERLEQCDELRQTIKNNNAVNQRLIRQALKYISFNINLATQTTADDFYGPPGKSGSVISKKKMFDATV